MLNDRRAVDRASRAVAQAGHRKLDERLDAAAAEEGWKAERCICSHTIGEHHMPRAYGLNKPVATYCYTCDCRRFELAGA